MAGPDSISWSGRRESNPRLNLGRVARYHYATPALPPAQPPLPRHPTRTTPFVPFDSDPYHALVPPSVLVLEPYPGNRWRSITRYADGRELALRAVSAQVERAYAPWHPPHPLPRLRPWWTRQPAVRAALQGAFDVVHLADHALAHHVPRFIGRACVVVTVHDVLATTLPGYFRWPLTPLKLHFLRRPLEALSRADLLLSPSEFNRQPLTGRGDIDPSRVRIVPNVADPRFAPAARPDAERDLEQVGIRLPLRPRVLSVGHTGTYKNLGALFEAMDHPDLAQAVLVRAGQRASPLLYPVVRRLEAEGRLVQLGPIDDDELRLLYATCDVLAQPSLAEGFGYPVVEAMRMGLPVVCSDGGALPEVAGDAAVIVPLGGGGFPGRFAAATGSVLADRALAERLRRAGRARVIAYEPEAVGRRLIEAYRAAGA